VAYAVNNAVDNHNSHNARIEEARRTGEVFNMDPGQTKDVPANSVVTGDIMINGEVHYDNLRETGLVTIFDSEAKVTAPVFTDLNGNKSGGCSGEQKLATEDLKLGTAENYANKTLENNSFINDVFIVRYKDGIISKVETISRAK